MGVLIDTKQLVERLRDEVCLQSEELNKLTARIEELEKPFWKKLSEGIYSFFG